MTITEPQIEVPSPEDPEAPETPSPEEPEAAREKRHRAPKTEIAQREARALVILEQKPVSAFYVSQQTGLSYPRVQSLVRQLVADGTADEIVEGKRVLYRKLPTTRPPARTARATPAPPINSATILNTFHMGREFKVVGVEVSLDGEFVKLQAKGEDATFRLSLVGHDPQEIHNPTAILLLTRGVAVGV